MSNRRTSWRDTALAAATGAFVVASMVAMVITVRGADRSTSVLLLEVATWIVATIAVATIPWRRTRWGRRDHAGRGDDERAPSGR